MKALLDIETDGLNATKIWVLVIKNLDTGQVFTYLTPPSNEELNWITEVVGHNIIDFDLPTLKRLWFLDFSHCKITDTLVLSRMLWQAIEGGHSLEIWGVRLSEPKIQFNDWSKLTQEMIDYCIQDVNLNHKLYNYLMSKMFRFPKPIDTEMKMTRICKDLNTNGFPFHATRARRILSVLEARVSLLDGQIQSAFPPKAKPVRVTTPSVTKNGSIARRVYSGIDPSSSVSIDSPFTVIQWETFNPASHKQLCERLHQSGWRPTVKTEAHSKAKTREEKAKHAITGWKVNEENLGTLPEDAPEAAKILVLRMMLETRIRKLKEWLTCYNERTGCIHGTFNSIGTWTHRMSHSNPNMGNISAAKSIKYNSVSLNKEATYLGGIFRSLWCAPKGKILVGVDAEGIQLRVLAHYMNDPKFTESVISGRKEDGTDPHSLNKKALGEVCKTRDKSKTFIYAFLLGAGTAKVAEIFDCSKQQAQQAVDNFIRAYPGLAKLKSTIIPSIAHKGFFNGLDERPIVVSEERLVLAGLLQEGEATLVKTALILALEKIKHIDQRLLNIVHDEMIFMVDDDGKTCYTVKTIVEEAIAEAGRMLNLNCPMKGDGHVGYNWLEIH